MAGKLQPLVLLPRFTTLMGSHSYSTVPLDVTPFSEAVVTVWRGLLGPAGGTAGLSFVFEESSDQDTWVMCSGTNVASDPGAEAQYVARATLKRRWLRLAVLLTGNSPTERRNVQVTSWAVGNLVRREE